MTPLWFTVIVFAAAAAAGLFGSLVGVGGGIIIVPTLALGFGLDIKYAVEASIVSVIATSSGAAAGYVRQHMTNLRVAMLLELATAAGAIAGAIAAAYVSPRFVFLTFGLLLAYTAWGMARRRPAATAARPPDPWADRLRLHGRYFDPAEGREVVYRVGRTKLGLLVSGFAGVMSGLLGIGGGTLKVPAMDLGMGIPLKVCTATSNFMMGVTAAASAAVYFMRGEVLPFVAAPVAAGVLVGATAGSRLLGRTKSGVVRGLFVAVLVVSAVQMLRKGVGP